jgi:deoxyxylulose-5-phosphate synthase
MASTDVMETTPPMHLAAFDDPNAVRQVPTRNGFGEGLLEAAKANKNVIGICADLSESTRMLALKETLPEQYIEIGVSEQLRRSKTSRSCA